MNNETVKKRKYRYGSPLYLVLLLGLIATGAQMFYFMRTQMLNTYIDHVLNLEPLFISYMVTTSAIMSLLFIFIWGVKSDNLRLKIGRRRPFLLIGGTIAGISMILFGFSPNYFWAFFINIILIGLSATAFSAAQGVLVPDLIKSEYRGRVNSIISIMTVFGMLASVVLTVVSGALFTIPNPDPGETGNILTQEGHILLLTIGGLGMIICGILGFLFIKDNVLPFELPPKKSFKSELKETFNIKLLKENKDFFKYLVAMTVFMSGVNGILSFMFNFIFSLELSTLDFGIVMGISSPILIIAILILGRLSDKVGRKKIVPPTILISCLGFFLVPIIAENPPINVPLFTVSLSLIFLGTLGAIVPLTTWYQDLLPEGEKAKFAGIYNLTNTVSMIIGTFAAGIIATLLKGVVINPLAWIFAVVPIFFVASIPIFLSVKETMLKVNKTK